MNSPSMSEKQLNIYEKSIEPEQIRLRKEKEKARRESNKLAMREERAAIAKMRIKLKIGIIDTLGGKCSECGYNRHKMVLAFHHLDPSLKEGKIGNMLTSAALRLYKKDARGCQKLIDEIKKCRVLCPTCHAEQHLNSPTV